MVQRSFEAESGTSPALIPTQIREHGTLTDSSDHGRSFLLENRS